MAAIACVIAGLKIAGLVRQCAEEIEESTVVKLSALNRDLSVNVSKPIRKTVTLQHAGGVTVNWQEADSDYRHPAGQHRQKLIVFSAKTSEPDEPWMGQSLLPISSTIARASESL